jgi:hypothetical protein
MASFPYIDEQGFWNVEATKVDEVSLYFQCPHCVYRKKPVIHSHGSGGRYHSRVEHRCGHCVAIPASHKGFNIHITENTARFLPKGI